ncbi:MAG: 3-phosphoshikimate 1-carboxyvinyltransferase [Verrucomicrobiae bacterium]|nr:3-phosphoshikimate 1-carboxyvinyltransferase [Verrucomicrobiae bacterium]
MMNYQVKASTLRGDIVIPPSKSHTLRAILFASLAGGESIIHHPLDSPDATAMMRACELLGAKIQLQKNQIIISGVAGKPRSPADVIDAGNSGIVLRFIAAVAALTSGDAVITGDDSIRTNRPIKPLLEGLTQLNVSAVSMKGDGYAPIMIKGPLQAGEAHLNGEDSQPVSALLIAAAFVSGTTTVHVSNPGEKPWIDLTLDWFDRLGIKYERNGYAKYQIFGGSRYAGFEYDVPGDFSSAAFSLVAAVITRSELTLHHLDWNDSQGDKAIFSILEKMGAQFVIYPEKKCICVKKSERLKGITIDINDCIDALPILSVLACFAEGETRLTGAAIARAKECDRLSAMTQELQKMGAIISEMHDGLIIQGAPLHAATVDSHHDHRVALSLAVAALATRGETTILNTNCITKSYPNFANNFQKIGANIEVLS